MLSYLNKFSPIKSSLFTRTKRLHRKPPNQILSKMMFFSQTSSIVAIVLASLLQGFTNGTSIGDGERGLYRGRMTQKIQLTLIPLKMTLTLPFSCIHARTRTGQVLINEVSVASIPGVCSGGDYVELINTGGAAANISGWMLYDSNGPSDEDAFIFPPEVVLAAGEIRFLCREFYGSFAFSIGNADTITLANRAGVVVSTTGLITSAGSSTTTFQLLANGTYVFIGATPGTVNGVTPTVGKPVISEVAFGTKNATLGPCFGAPFVELYNDAFAAVNLTGYTITSGLNSYTLPNGTLNRFQFFTVCVGAGILEIAANGNVGLSNPQGVPVSSTGPIGGSSPRPAASGLSWVRVVDEVLTSAPFTPFYQYTTTPTPNNFNVFPFVPVTLPYQACGTQAGALLTASDYALKSITNIFVNGGDPELSGISFDPRTCNYHSVGDEGQLLEFSLVGNTASVVRARAIVNGETSSPDAEGNCFYRDAVNGDKLVYTDEDDNSGKSMYQRGH